VHGAAGVARCGLGGIALMASAEMAMLEVIDLKCFMAGASTLLSFTSQKVGALPDHDPHPIEVEDLSVGRFRVPVAL
jgi:hypothetical protein